MIAPEPLNERLSRHRTYPFALWWHGRRVARLRTASAVKRTTGVVARPRDQTIDTVTLTGGITDDPAFNAWASQGGPDCVEVILEHRDELGRLSASYHLAQCQVVVYDAAPAVDPPDTVTIRTIALEHRGWTRDVVVVEPTDPFGADPGR